MQESIFATPAALLDESRVSWMFTDAAEDTMLDANRDQLYATDEPSLGLDEWPMH